MNAWISIELYKNLWNMRMTVIPIQLLHLAQSQSALKNLKELEITGRIEAFETNSGLRETTIIPVGVTQKE